MEKIIDMYKAVVADDNTPLLPPFEYDPENPAWYDFWSRVYDISSDAIYQYYDREFARMYGDFKYYDFLEEEKMGARKLRPVSSVARFVVFCIERYRLRGGLSPAAVLAMFKESGVEEFLMRNFEVLHSQSVEYILREIDLFIKKQR